MSLLTKDMYCRACAVDLYDFLLCHHAADVKEEYDSILLKADKHISVKRGFHGYMNFKTGETGNNVKYLQNFLGYDYRSAVFALIADREDDSTYVNASEISGHSKNTNSVPSKLPAQRKTNADGVDTASSGILEWKAITLPKPLDGPYKNLFAYLSARQIPADVIRRLIDDGILYQSEQGNNIVFVTPQGDYCEIRGTNTFADKRCKRRDNCNSFCPGEHSWCVSMDTCGTYKPDPFHGTRKSKTDRFWYFAPSKDKPSEIIYICEAAIDAVSLYVIHALQGINTPAVYVSIGGVANQSAIDRIVRNASDKTVILAVDNDPAGQECRDRNPQLKAIIPTHKDWNDDLRKGDTL